MYILFKTMILFQEEVARLKEHIIVPFIVMQKGVLMEIMYVNQWGSFLRQ